VYDRLVALKCETHHEQFIIISRTCAHVTVV